MVSEIRGVLLLRGGARWESHLERSSAVGVFGTRRTVVRPRLQAPATAPTHCMGRLAQALLRTAAPPPGRAPSTVGSV
jgi:hypothetical protein